MSRTMRHRDRDGLSEFYRRIGTGTDRKARGISRRFRAVISQAERKLAERPLPSPLERQQAERR